MASLDSGEPFGLPKGTVRGLLALGSFALLAFDFGVDQTLTPELVYVVSPFIGFYFGTRGSEPPAPAREDDPLPPPALGDAE